MKLPFTRTTAPFVIALAFTLSGSADMHADAGAEISHEAAKLNHRGLDHLHKKEYEQAIASFREALQIQPEFPDALDNLGKALEAIGKDGEAIAEFDKAIKLGARERRRLCRRRNGPLP
jgi:Flp pilus assembly protein TadD